MNRHCCMAALLGMLILTHPGSPIVAQETTDKAPATVDEAAVAATARAAAEAELQKTLSGAALVGFFTIDGSEQAALKPDRYRLAAVNKVRDDYWLFVYSHNDLPIPLTLKVLWAGNTPVLTLDEFKIAGMGTFSARVMFHGTRYAGTWQHGSKGGLMFGHIEPKSPVPGSATSTGNQGDATDKDPGTPEGDKQKVPNPREE